MTSLFWQFFVNENYSDHLARVGGDEFSRPPPFLVVHGATGVAPVSARVVLTPAFVLLKHRVLIRAEQAKNQKNREESGRNLSTPDSEVTTL